MDPLVRRLVDYEKIRTIEGDRMVGPLGKVASPFRPITRKTGGDSITVIRRRDVGYAR